MSVVVNATGKVKIMQGISDRLDRSLISDLILYSRFGYASIQLQIRPVTYLGFLLS